MEKKEAQVGVNSMLRDIAIDNYRCFKKFQVTDFAPVNLLVGMNNSGKTSLLEAIYLLVNQGNPRCLSELLDYRGEFSESNDPENFKSASRRPNYQTIHIFHNHQLNTSNTISLESNQEQRLSLEISTQLSQRLQELLDGLGNLDPSLVSPRPRQVRGFGDLETNSEKRLEIVQSANSQTHGLVFWYESGGERAIYRIPMEIDDSISGEYSQSFQRNSKNWFLPTNSISVSRLSKWWDQITLTPKEEKVIDALRILEPMVERLNFTGRLNASSNILLKLKGTAEPIPISSMGEGMRRILTLAMAAVMAEGGVLLVDEIDTGLYYESQKQMWHLMMEVAIQLKVQIFATTHSWDCVSAFGRAMNGSNFSEIGKLLRLDRRDSQIQAVNYTAKQLSTAIRQDIEVR